MRSAISAVGAGHPVVVVEEREAPGAGDAVGHLLLAAEHVATEQIAMAVRFSSGFLCVAMPDDAADRLELPALPQDERTAAPRFTVSVDAVGTGTGISAADRAFTVQQLANPHAGPTDFSRPGHVVGIRTHSEGVLGRRQVAEAGVDLAVFAGVRPVVTLAAIPSPSRPTVMATAAELRGFAEYHGFPVVSVGAVLAHQLRHAKHVEPTGGARIPLAGADFTAVGYRSQYDDREHVAFVLGDICNGDEVLARVHSECVLGDVFGSRRCQCADRLQASLERITAEGRGVVVYLREREASSNGLLAKLAAYGEHDRTGSTLDAHRLAGPPRDPRDTVVGAQILRDLGVRSLRLLTSTPVAGIDLTDAGLEIVEQLPVLPIDRVHFLSTERGRRSLRKNSRPASA
jgi:3,4-dihydroxy 2-butanone 4-phosphate synthase/GTP cyclohydrolase II